MERTLGIDVSYAQGSSLDWPSIRASGVAFAFCKASEGVSGVDPTFSRNARGARNAGLLVGAYHYFRPEQDPEVQAGHFHQVAHGLVELPPVMDFETCRALPPPVAYSRALAFLLASEELWGRQMVLYTYPAFWRSLGDPDELYARPLWIAHYGVHAPLVPAPWAAQGWTLWQFDGNGGRRLPGGTDCDFDWYAGSLEQLRELARGFPLTPSTVPPPPAPAGVEEIQRALAALRYPVGPVDGILGPKTKTAIKAFQMDEGLTPDGIAGPQTIEKLLR